MSDEIYIDGSCPNSYMEIRDSLYSNLKSIVKNKRPIIFLCIGTDRSTGDSLGPLIGHKLNFLKRKNFYIYGTLENPIHSKNISTILSRISDNFEDPYIIAIDACLGSVQSVGKVVIKNEPLLPGSALNKDLPPVGDMCITGIVNLSGNFDYLVLQNTRLHTVMSLADSISNGIYHFILKSVGGKNKIEDLNSFLK